MRTHRALASGLGLAGLVLGCGNDDAAADTWTRLAHGFRPAPLAERVAAWDAELADDERARVRVDASELGIWLEGTLPRASWEPGEGGVWSAPRPARGAFAHAGDRRVRLGAAADGYTKVRAPGAGEEAAPTPGSFHLTAERIHLCLPPGEEPAPSTSFAVLLEHGTEYDGRWRVKLGRTIGDGIPVFSETEEELSVAVPRGSRLRFATVFANASGKARFRVHLDDAEIFAHEETAGRPEGTWHEVSLPATRRGTLRFRVEGPPGLGLFVDPTVGPASSPSRRPDLVLFLADTFRADNLEAYGGPPDVTPHLNALARRSVRFLQARAPAAWTLPSVASLLTGRHPQQHGALERDSRLSDDVVSIAEALARYGYRTVGVTDGAYVSQAHNLDQGFAWYQEAPRQSERSLIRTFALAEELLARDDGRPVFLLVHTYRPHTPYRTSGPGAGEEDPRAFWRVMRAINEDGGEDPDPDVRNRAALAHADELEALYRAGARAMDARVGDWVAGLEERGFFETGHLVVTSDHGEAFGEHDEMWHEGRLWEEKIRIPLLFRGPGLAPRDVRLDATLVDLPVTLVDLVGLPPDPSWRGASLFALEEERPVLSYRLKRSGPHELAIVSGERKVLAPYDLEALARGSFQAAYDLRRDPGEAAELDEPAWATELVKRIAATLSELATDTVPASTGELGAEHRRALAELGYVGE